MVRLIILFGYMTFMINNKILKTECNLWYNVPKLPRP